VPEVDRSNEEADSVSGLLRQAQKVHPHADVRLHPDDARIAGDLLFGGVTWQGKPKLNLGSDRWGVMGVDEAARLADVLDSSLNGRGIG